MNFVDDLEVLETRDIARYVVQGPMEPIWVQRPENALIIERLLAKIIAELPTHGFTIENFGRMIKDGSMRIWVRWDMETGAICGVYGTRMYTQPNGRLVLGLHWAASDTNEGGTDVDIILGPVEAYAREHGCYGVEIVGRRGWSRLLKNAGYGHQFTGVLKEL